MNERFVKSLAMVIVCIMTISAFVAIVPFAASGSADASTAPAQDAARQPVSLPNAPAANSLPSVDHVDPNKIVKIYVRTSNITALDELLVQEGIKPTNRIMNPYLNVVALTVPQRVADMIQGLS